MHTLPDLLRAYRLGSELTQEALAARVGVSRSLVAQWEIGGSRPTLARLGALSRALGLSVRERDALIEACEVDDG